MAVGQVPPNAPVYNGPVHDVRAPARQQADGRAVDHPVPPRRPAGDAGLPRRIGVLGQVDAGVRRSTGATIASLTRTLRDTEANAGEIARGLPAQNISPREELAKMSRQQAHIRAVPIRKAAVRSLQISEARRDEMAAGFRQDPGYAELHQRLAQVRAEHPQKPMSRLDRFLAFFGL